MGDKTVCLLPALLLLTVPGAHSSAVTGPGAVNGTERGSLTVRCHYEPRWEPYVKYWCRGGNWSGCRILVQTSGSEQEVEKGRVSIRDHQKNRTFSVTMKGLRLDDADTYWCGIERVGADLGVQVQVTVLPGAHSSAITGPGAVNGTEKGLLTVPCRYGPGYETYVKWWCRGADWHSCRILVQTSGSEQEVRKGRVSIRDHQKSRMFSVTMEGLRLDDADTYWCGIERVGADLGVQVRVTILPATTVSARTIATTTVITTSTAAHTAHVTPGESKVPPTPSNTSSLLGSVHFLLPVFLKVPLLLSMLSAVLWVNRPQRRPGGRRPPPDYENQPP